MRILETAWSLLRSQGLGELRVADIAQASGVSRQALYLHFENRAGLLLALARHVDVRSGFIERVGLTRRMPPVEGLEAMLREWFAYIPEISPLARALEAAAITGDEGASAWHDRMADLWRGFLVAVQRIEKQGRLAAGWTAEAAADWVWARSHLSSWHHLVVERGWPPDVHSERVISSILAELVTPEPGLSIGT